MADERFFDRRGPFTLAHLAAEIGAELAPGGDPDFEVEDIASLEGASGRSLVFAQGKHVKALSGCEAGAAIVAADPQLDDAPKNLLIVAAPDKAFISATCLFYPGAEHSDARSPAAHIDGAAKLEDGVGVGPGAVIEAGAEIGAGSMIGPGAYIGRGVAIGRNCRIGPNANVTHALIGDKVTLHSGVVIGGDGFGYHPGADGHTKIPQLGRVIIQDAVEIGPNSAIDRGRLDDTVIGEGTKIDNLVHIAHNCRIGRHCIIAAQVGMSGSVTIEDFVVLFGQVGIADHLTIGAHSVALAKAGISRSIASGSIVAGYPARPVKQWHKEVGLVARLAKRRPGGGGAT